MRLVQVTKHWVGYMEHPIWKPLGSSKETIHVQVILSGFGINLNIYHKTAWTKQTTATTGRAALSPHYDATHQPDKRSSNHNPHHGMNFDDNERCTEFNET